MRITNLWILKIFAVIKEDMHFRISKEFLQLRHGMPGKDSEVVPNREGIRVQSATSCQDCRIYKVQLYPLPKIALLKHYPHVPLQQLCAVASAAHGDPFPQTPKHTQPFRPICPATSL